MLKYCHLVFFVLISSVAFSQVVWFEDFEGEADGEDGVPTPASASGGTWQVTTAPGGTFSKQDVAIVGNSFNINNTPSEGVWETNDIDISSYGYAILDIELNIGGFSTGANDYIRAYYVLNGGSTLVQFGEIIGSGSLITTSIAASVIVQGTSVKVVVTGFDDSGGVGQAAFDNVIVTGVSTLYSTNAGGTSTWDQGTTWSTTGFGGAVCNCTPNNLTRILIGSGYSIGIDSESDAIYLEVQSGGALTWTVASDLNIGRGGMNVQSGGSVSSGASTTAQIDFDLEYNMLPMVVDGSLVIGDLEINGVVTLSISGNGTLTIFDDLLINNDVAINSTLASQIPISGDITITGNSDLTLSKTGAVTAQNLVVTDGDDITFSGAGTLSFSGDIDINNTSDIVLGGGNVSVGGDVRLDASNINFTNNTQLTITGMIRFDGDNSDVINNGTLTTTELRSADSGDDDNVITNSVGATLDFSEVNPSTGDIDIFNSGTINQTGNFTNISAGDTNIDNLANGVWNWSYVPGTAVDTDLGTVLNCSASNNTFNYTGAGNQLIFGSQYHHIGFSGSGTKTSQANLDANGNVTISGSAVLDVDTGNDTFTIAGNWENTSAAGDSFLQGTETVTLNGGGGQTITNANGETFYNLVLGLGATANTVQMNNALTVSNTLTLTTGGLNLNGNQLNITRNATAAMAAGANGYLIGESSAAAVVWNMRTTTGTFTFPFRNAAGGTAMAVTFNKTSAGTESGTGAFSVATYGTGAANTPYPSGVLHTKNSSGVDISANVADRFWIIDPLNYSANPNATVTFRIVNAERPTGFPNLAAQRWNSASELWDAPIGGQTSTTTSAQVAIPGTFSAWALSDVATPLPIELVSFSASQAGNRVQFNWTTASELNNDFFTVERLNANDGFDAVLSLPGKGTTNENSNYEAFDSAPIDGKNYYRLKQTDFDGQFSYSEIVMVDFKDTGDSFKVYPVPAHHQDISIELRNLQPQQEVTLDISTVLGLSAVRTTLRADDNGVINAVLPTSGLQKGMYIINAGGVEGSKRKIIIE